MEPDINFIHGYLCSLSLLYLPLSNLRYACQALAFGSCFLVVAFTPAFGNKAIKLISKNVIHSQHGQSACSFQSTFWIGRISASFQWTMEDIWSIPFKNTSQPFVPCFCLHVFGIYFRMNNHIWHIIDIQ